MAEFKESETRRVVEGGALSEQTALEWIGERAEDELFREAGAMRCGKKGTVSIFECTSAYRDALQHVEDGLKLQGACAPLRRAVLPEMFSMMRVCLPPHHWPAGACACDQLVCLYFFLDVVTAAVVVVSAAVLLQY